MPTNPHALIASLREHLGRMTPRPWATTGLTLYRPTPAANRPMQPHDAAGIVALVNAAEELVRWADERHAMVQACEAIPCRCDAAYKDRKLTDPDCARCNVVDDILAARSSS